MLQRVFPAARIHGVAVCEEWLAAKFFYHICNGLGIVRPEIADIAKFTKMHFDRYKFAVHIQLGYAGFFNEFFQLCGKTVTKCNRVKVGKVYF